MTECNAIVNMQPSISLSVLCSTHTATNYTGFRVRSSLQPVVLLERIRTPALQPPVFPFKYFFFNYTPTPIPTT